MMSGKGKGPDGADAIIDELENRGKQRRNAHERAETATNPQILKRSPWIRMRLSTINLTLKGISGVGAKRLALINNQALREGESELVKVEGSKMKVLCKEIKESSVFDPGRKQARHH